MSKRADKLDKATNVAVLAVLLCAFGIASGGMFFILLLGAAALAVPAWELRRRRIREDARRAERLVARQRRKERRFRLRRNAKPGALKPYEPNLMPLGLRKAVRTGDPIPEAKRLPVPQFATNAIRKNVGLRDGSGDEGKDSEA